MSYDYEKSIRPGKLPHIWCPGCGLGTALTCFLSALRESLAMRLSGGERRRLEIARSLTMEPAFILLDEPFAGIDPISISDIQSIIKQLASEGIGILITDHNVRETLGICHRGYIISNGEVLAQGEPQLLLDNPDVRDVYLGHDFRM